MVLNDWWSYISVSFMIHIFVFFSFFLMHLIIEVVEKISSRGATSRNNGFNINTNIVQLDIIAMMVYDRRQGFSMC